MTNRPAHLELREARILGQNFVAEGISRHEAMCYLGEQRYSLQCIERVLAAMDAQLDRDAA